jgi:TPR repeat protein
LINEYLFRIKIFEEIIMFKKSLLLAVRALVFIVIATLMGCGVAHENSRGVAHNYAEMAKLYRKAAQQGDAYAQYNLGSMYNHGQGVAQDYAQAVKWYTQAAHQGHPDAQYNLGVMYDNGQGVTQDHVEAVKWYRKAAKQGDV